mmetsp:Transcript_44732/g.114383  ORF Transcript_44732/g.114383 Transcript_44732/m.114383 type:complete len:309 (-) Transcript_44732:268-1194(-)
MMTTCICRVGSAYYSLLTTCLRQVAEVASIDEARSNGNIVISAVDPSKERAPDSPASTVSTASKLVKSAAADARYTVQQVMFDDMQSLAWKDRLVELKSESDGKLLTSSCRFFTSIFTLYPKLHIADITTHPLANCVAFTSETPLSRSLLQHKPYAEDLLPRLCQQDKWPVFKRAINKWASKTVTVQTRTSNAYKVAPRSYVLVVADNEVSRDAFDFFCGFIGTNMSTGDTLYIMTCAKTEDEKIEGQKLLETFKARHPATPLGSLAYVATIIHRPDVMIQTLQFIARPACQRFHVDKTTMESYRLFS